MRNVIEQMVFNIDNVNVKALSYSSQLGDKYAATASKYMVLEMTGPLMFSKILWKYQDDSSVLVQDNLMHEYFEYSGYRDHIGAYRYVDSQHYSAVNDVLVLG